MRLAAHFQRIDVDRMLREISGQQLSEWIAYFQLEPHGPARGDLQAGIIASQVANLFREKGSRAAQPGDYLLTFEAKPKKRKSVRQTPDQIRDILMGVVERTKANPMRRNKGR